MNTTESRPEKSTPGGGEHWALFGPPPLFEGEDSKIYDQLVTEIFNAVTPADILEEIWLRDIVDLTIDVLRLRRLKADLMNANALKSPTENLATIFCLKLNNMERIEHLMALAEARRNASLREIDRHRQTLGQKLRLAGQQLEDGQLRLIESTPTSIDGPKLK